MSNDLLSLLDGCPCLPCWDGRPSSAWRVHATEPILPSGVRQRLSEPLREVSPSLIYGRNSTSVV